MDTPHVSNITDRKILIIGTSPMSLYHHRLELIKKMISHHINVFLASPPGEEVELIENAGCTFIPIEVETRGTNPFADLRLLKYLVNVIKDVRPDLVLTFYTKTNIYGGLACRLTHTPYIENITGLGSALGNGGLKGKLMSILYKSAIKSADLVYFQNKSNKDFFETREMVDNPTELLPGSGVALDRHSVIPYPKESKKIRFAFIGRVLRQKGIFEYVEAARTINKKNPHVEFHVIGPAEGSILDWLQELAAKRQIFYHGKVIDTRPIIKDIHCTVFPSFYPEGMANVLLESASAGRPVITTDCPGCRETVRDGETGYMVEPRDVKSLIEAMEKFIKLPLKEKEAMGLRGRKKMEAEFDRNIVVDSYLNHIASILDGA